jgi:hypothetical protein
VKVAKIRHHQEQIIKIRASLGQPGGPIDEITRPAGMNRSTFRKKMARIAHHHNEITRLMLEGLEQYK